MIWLKKKESVVQHDLNVFENREILSVWIEFKNPIDGTICKDYDFPEEFIKSLLDNEKAKLFFFGLKPKE